jgi:transcriptional regulator GlxA family with amidase domain
MAATIDFAFDAVERADTCMLGARRLTLLEALLHDSADAYLSAFKQDAGEKGERGCSRFLLVRRAERIISEEYDDVLSVATIARRLRVSTRTLQNAFEVVHGVSPRSFLNTFRLERARDMLVHSSGHPSVASIALACGFCHLGRFSAAYRARYGELPSKTLLR